MKTFDHNIETGDVIEREMTKDELAAMKRQSELDAVARDEGQKLLEAKEAAQAKLASLGLTENDLKALGL